MAGGASGKGGVADASLNVVPFIDLLACTICFLLVSAVWTQFAKINVEQALPKRSPGKVTQTNEPKINIAITSAGYVVNLSNADKLTPPQPELAVPTKIPLLSSEIQLCRGKGTVADCQGDIERYRKYDRVKLHEVLAMYLKAANMGDKVKIMVAAADPVQYIHLISTLDAILTVCDAKDPAVCLKNPSVGDVNLLKAEGFDVLELTK